MICWDEREQRTGLDFFLFAIVFVFFFYTAWRDPDESSRICLVSHGVFHISGCSWV